MSSGHAINGGKEQVSGEKTDVQESGANGFHEKNGYIQGKGQEVKLRLRNKKIQKANGGGAENGNGAVNEDSTMEDSVMNGIDDIKISDEMDIDEEVGAMAKDKDNSLEGPGSACRPAASHELSNGISNSAGPVDNGAVKMEIKEEVALPNGMVNANVPPPIIQKCANGKLVCTMDGIPSFPCKRCHRVFYCSDEHRQQHFKEHQPDCKTVSSLEVIVYEEEYSMWLKHAAPHLYDTCLNFVLVWPSLTVQWLPEITELENNLIRHQLLLGTMTNQEQNHLLICGIDVIDRSKTDSNISVHAAKYSGTMTVLKRINHEAEVNRARYMPQDCNIVATKSSSPEVFIFDCSKHPEVPENSTFSPLLRLRGHQKEGFGLSWSGKDRGKILSGSNDGLVCLWDLNKTASNGSNGMRYLDASHIFKGHEDVVEDVDWHPEHKQIFASVGDDKRLILWDARTYVTEEAVINRADAHVRDINAVSFSPFSEHCLATGSSDHTVAVWDMRNLKQKVHSLEYHRGEVMQVQWSPHGESILASTGKDNRVFVWDLSKVMKADDATTMQGYDDDPAPAELVFIHGGHIANVNDISWNFHELGMIASVTEDNILQVWKISEDLQAVYAGEVDSDDESQGSVSDVLMDD